MSQTKIQIFRDKIEAIKRIDRMKANGWKVFTIQNIGDGQYEVIFKNYNKD